MAVLQLGLIAGFGLYLGRAVSFLMAATVAWWLNRSFTFPDASRQRPLRQLGNYLSANAAGGVLNYGVYAICVSKTAFFAHFPLLAIALGALGGLLFNFTVSRSYVFRSDKA